jgi:hypothetical protein
MKKFIVLMICYGLLACNQAKDEPPISIADPKYIDMSRNILTSLCKGDIDEFIKNYAVDAKYRWNYGDSLVGRKAIYDYWKERRTSAIDTIIFKNETWLAIKAYNPPKHIPPGIYVLNWSDFTVTYSDGISVNSNIHTVFGFNSQDSLMSTRQYLDRSLITEALKPRVKPAD